MLTCFVVRSLFLFSGLNIHLSMACLRICSLIICLSILPFFIGCLLIGNPTGRTWGSTVKEVKHSTFWIEGQLSTYTLPKHALTSHVAQTVPRISTPHHAQPHPPAPQRQHPIPPHCLTRLVPPIRGTRHPLQVRRLRQRMGVGMPSMYTWTGVAPSARGWESHMAMSR
jgi:hypothetical protein